MKTFLWCDLNKVLHLFFCKRRAAFFEVKQRWAPFLPRFSGILPRNLGILPDFQEFCPDFQGFSTNQNFGGVLSSPASPPPTPLTPHILQLPYMMEKVGRLPTQWPLWFICLVQATDFHDDNIDLLV